MHRLSSIPGSDEGGEVVLVEQPTAPLLLLTSAQTDISTLARVLEAPEAGPWRDRIRALPLDALQHQAQIDHYLASTGADARLIVVRLLGGRGHWSYGFEQVLRWQEARSDRQLIVLAGTPDQDRALHSLSSVPEPLCDALAALMREGGPENLRRCLDALALLLAGEEPETSALEPLPMADPAPWQWQDTPGPRVGVILYRALARAGDTAVAEALLTSLRRRGLVPRALWVSSLRDPVVQQGVLDLLQQQQVELVITTTAFASVQFEEAGLGSPLWDQLDRPVLQVLSSGRSRQVWADSSRGLDPLDLSLQVVLPELDGRITTRVGGFREQQQAHASLATAVHGLEPDLTGLDWVVQHAEAWIALRRSQARERRVALVLANYPIRNGRVANGVGLDTPASLHNALHWLQESGHDLGVDPLPDTPEALMQALLRGRSNDPESHHRPALDHLPLGDYQAWWQQLPAAARQAVEGRWGPPEQAVDLDTTLDGSTGFAIHGLRFGHVVVLIQPSRGYDPDQLSDLHSPDLPPPHRYLAQYLWMRQVHGCQVMVHLGKHGSAEWLPGKAVGLSETCAPALALGPIPHLYPFIVNDPGEGSQAKRRGHAVILDHLTPPLGRAGSHGDLVSLEQLLDEVVEARQLGSERCGVLDEQLLALLTRLNWPGLPSGSVNKTQERQALFAAPEWSHCLEQVETYLCELKEAQIRTGLHRLGAEPEPHALVELLLAIARCPGPDRLGLTQAMARRLGLNCDPWADEDGQALQASDQAWLEGHGVEQPRRIADAVDWLEHQGSTLIQRLIEREGLNETDGQALHADLERWLLDGRDPSLLHLTQSLMPRLRACADREREGFLHAIAGGRIASGPSGAPTRGRPDVLPTGRNFYSVDLRGLPTEAAWDLGRRSAEQLLELYLLEEGEPLRHLALSVWGTATMRNGGEDIAQMLALLGVRPVWDGPTRRLVDLEVIPLALLQRPRVDVTLRISGLFRDAFPQLVRWVDRALALVAGLDEDAHDNPLAACSRDSGRPPRVFGSAPGAYGAGLQALIDSGQWEEQSDLAEAFLSWSRWAYDGQGEPQEDREGLERSLREVQVVLHNQDNREHDLLDSDDYYQFQGGLAAAVTAVRGRPAALWFADHSRRERLRLHPLGKEIDKVMRSRLLNPRWIEGMRGHGYKGAFEMAASLDYLFAYDASSGVVQNWCYAAVQDAWLDDRENLAFLIRHNPWALRDMAERLLEAANRQLWSDATPERLERLRQLVLEAEARVEHDGLKE